MKKPRAQCSGDFPAGLFDLAQSPANAFGVLGCGLALFAAALWYDMRDPHRLSRYSANAFWLHILAAPAIVNTVSAEWDACRTEIADASA